MSMGFKASESVGNTVMCSLMKGICSEKCDIRQLCCWGKITGIECTYTNLDGIYSLLHTWVIWYSLSLLGYKPVQYETILNTVGNWNTMVFVYQNISKHRKWYNKIYSAKYFFLMARHLAWMELVGLKDALGESVSAEWMWRPTVHYCTLL